MNKLSSAIEVPTPLRKYTSQVCPRHDSVIYQTKRIDPFGHTLSTSPTRLITVPPVSTSLAISPVLNPSTPT